MAETSFLSGDLEAALRYCAEAISQLRAMGYTRNLLVALNNAATYFKAAQRWQDARDAAREALAQAEETEASVVRIWALQHLAATAALSPASVVQSESAAMLLGYVDAQLTAHGLRRTGSERHEYHRARSALSAALNAKELERQLAAGASLLTQGAVDLARSL